MAEEKSEQQLMAEAQSGSREAQEKLGLRSGSGEQKAAKTEQKSAEKQGQQQGAQQQK